MICLSASKIYSLEFTKEVRVRCRPKIVNKINANQKNLISFFHRKQTHRHFNNGLTPTILDNHTFALFDLQWV